MTQLLHAQSGHGYFSYDRVVATLPQNDSGQHVLEAKEKQFKDSITIFVKREFRKIDLDDPKPAQFDSLTNELNKIQRKLIHYQDSAQLELKAMEAKIQTEIMNFLNEQLRNYCKNRKLACVADKRSILYCADCSDLTDDFLLYLKFITWLERKTK
jgi:Skp family chaperone for outer membrane proteins